MQDDSEAPTRVAGLYSAVSPAASFSTPSLFDAVDIGIVFDHEGKQVNARGFHIKIFMDIPMNRFTVYFSERGGIGGTSEATRTRMKKYPNKKS
ncbi:hypothetical protein [Ereboglobus luteus]|uniref:hypothetical protein n=1 Tax=Ereboglobus luteus TaxID=1796921 RepID=UPI0012601E56|nr:hypothetical protein [Ereboglobus luteus]